MFWPYWLSVVVIALAIFGLWHMFGQFAAAWLAAGQRRPFTVSLLVIIRNAEAVVEGELRYLLDRVEATGVWQDLVVVDHGSDDLTPAILLRLAQRHPLITAVCLPAAARPVADGLAYCRGEVVEVVDLVNRLSAADFGPAVRLLSSR